MDINGNKEGAKIAWSQFVPAAGRRFVKMQGLHNHFVIVDGRHEPYVPSVAEIKHICDPQVGVGGEQLLIAEPPSPAGTQVGAHAFMRILNIDGREVGACGNATRCLAWLLLEEMGRDNIIIETAGGTLLCERVGDRTVRVAMGRISTDWADIPLATEVDVHNVPVGNGPLQNGMALSIGNPHIVFFVDDLDSLDVAALAEPVQNAPLFPEKVNVDVAQVVSETHIRLSVFERPGILTAACGSGACVTARAAQLRGLTDENQIRVEMPAGALDIAFDDNAGATMTGPVAYCFIGRLPHRERAFP